MACISVTIFAFIAPSLCQYAVNTGLRPDIAFGDYNDRFDLTDIINYQQGHYKDYGLAQDEDGQEFRRYHHQVPSNKREHYRKVGKDYDTRKNMRKLGRVDEDKPEEYRRYSHKIHKTDKKERKQHLKTNKDYETRKNAKKLARMQSKAREDHVNQLANEILLSMVPKRRFIDDFAYHDNMNEGGGDEFDFAENLKRFDVKNDNDKLDTLRRMEGYIYKLHGQKNTRRVLDPQKELLFHHGFPIDMKIKGYLQVPLQ